MKLTKCSNNHFYDADKSPCCPQCGEYPGAKMKSNQEKPAAAAAGFGGYVIGDYAFSSRLAKYCFA